MSTKSAYLSPQIIKEDSSDDKSKNCSLQWEINNEEDNSGVSVFSIGSSYKARLYYGPDVEEEITTLITKGIISKQGSGMGSKTQQITFSGSRTSSLAYPCENITSATISGKAFDLDGNIVVPNFKFARGTTSISTDIECFCVVTIIYITKYNIYLFSSYEEGEVLLIAISECNNDELSAEISAEFEAVSTSASSASLSSISSSSSQSEIATTTIVLHYKDFVTGYSLGDVSVYIDGISRGRTNANGKLTVHGITVNTVHTLRASKKGYLNTDSDSLENDQFIINT